jgi:hypothetical protein
VPRERRRGRAEAEAELAAEPEAQAELDPEMGDDGALHHFWRWVELRQAEGRPAFDLDDLREFAQAVDEFDHEAATRSDAP